VRRTSMAWRDLVGIPGFLSSDENGGPVHEARMSAA
jgi:hypothetical protein